MPSHADTITASGAPVTLAAPPAQQGGAAFNQVGYTVVPRSDELVVLSLDSGSGASGQTILATGYSLDGTRLFQDQWQEPNGPFGHLSGPTLTTLGNGNVAVAWQFYQTMSQASDAQDQYSVLSPAGVVIKPQTGVGTLQTSYTEQQLPALYATATGFNVEFNEQTNLQSGGRAPSHEVRVFDASGTAVTATGSPGARPAAIHAFAPGSAGSLQIADNQVQYFDGAALHAAVTIPGEPASAITGEAAAMLTDGQAAVAWVDSGTDYVALFDPTTNSFGPRIGLDWGSADHIEAIALTDGGFAVSWAKGGQYKGEVFTADGTGGGVINLAGDLAGVDSHGNPYTVSRDSNGAYVVQTYAVSGASTGTGGGSGAAGQTYTSDNAGDHWTGTAGNDIFNLGRGGDVVTGNGGDDTFKFAETPWAGGHITDFNIGDKIDLTGLLAASGYAGGDPVGAGYLKLTTDSQGNGQVWADYNQPGNDGWWLVTTVDGVGAYDLRLQDGVITHAPGPSPDGTVYTADPNYQAPAGVTKIVLTGSQQTVTGNNAGDTFVSNDTGNHLIGGTGADTFDLGRGGDIVTGGAGADTYVYQETPWAGGRITDFSVSQGDRIDLNALLAHAGYTSGDPIAEGYIKILDTTNGAQVWADSDGAGSASGWWLVDTLSGPSAGAVSAGTISLSGGMVTGGGNGAVVVEDARYTAFRTGVTSITLAGSSAQQIFGNDLGITYHDSNNANLIIGGAGNDTFILGSGGSSVSTGAGADTVVINGVPTSHESLTGYTAGTDRIDLRGLLSSIGSTGSDPFNDGHLRFLAVSDSSGSYTELQANDPVHSQWVDVVQIYNTTPSQLHYSDGWLT